MLRTTSFASFYFCKHFTTLNWVSISSMSPYLTFLLGRALHSNTFCSQHCHAPCNLQLSLFTLWSHGDEKAVYHKYFPRLPAVLLVMVLDFCHDICCWLCYWAAYRPKALLQCPIMAGRTKPFNKGSFRAQGQNQYIIHGPHIGRLPWGCIKPSPDITNTWMRSQIQTLTTMCRSLSPTVGRLVPCLTCLC
jgi:hypothetical protein